MAHTASDKRRVYLECAGLFVGQTALFRQRPVIHEFVLKHKARIPKLIGDLGITKVVDIAQDLLKARIFEQVSRAKVEFPESFQASAAQDAPRTECELIAAQSAAEDALVDEQNDQNSEGLAEASLDPARPKDDDAYAVGPPSQHTACLPYGAQHAILTAVQRVLEECCFDSWSNHRPDLLEGRDCASAVELTTWTRLLTKDSGGLPEHALRRDGKNFTKVVSSIYELRHTAVHRIPIPARRVSQLVQCAIAFAEALLDNHRAAQLKDLHDEIENKIEAMQLRITRLEEAAAKELQEVYTQRAELDRKATEIAEHLAGNSHSTKSFAGRLLEESVGNIFREADPASVRGAHGGSRHSRWYGAFGLWQISTQDDTAQR
ncbi:hypothetical protein MKZ38_009488 [Zalerion maritima]|uniref:Uncharacterized protein n=1 Tax=Zalerion maritima TaxID=339359 RepID=A0AAD5RGC5_9PEZI|nr:hypothetical protein MKZ38_009488 [Zalerion maritima]